MGLVEGVEHDALHLGAPDLLELASDLVADAGLQVVEAFGAKAFGELLVDLWLHGAGHLFHLDGELSGFAGQRRHLVVGGEVGLDDPLLARLGALETVLEAGNEATLTDHQRQVLGLAAVELGAVDAADEIDGQAVAVAGGAAFLGLMGGIALGQALESLGRHRRRGRRPTCARARGWPGP